MNTNKNRIGNKLNNSANQLKIKHSVANWKMRRMELTKKDNNNMKYICVFVKKQ